MSKYGHSADQARHVPAARRPSHRRLAASGAQADGGVNFPHFVEMAQTAERGLFDMMFSADEHTGWTVSEAAIEHVHYCAWIEPKSLLTALAGHTTHRARLHREHELRRALSGRAQVRVARPDQRRPLRLELGHLRQRDRGAEFRPRAASAEGRALPARPRVRRRGARAVG